VVRVQSSLIQNLQEIKNILMLHDFYILFLFQLMGCNHPANDTVGGQELEERLFLCFTISQWTTTRSW